MAEGNVVYVRRWYILLGAPVFLMAIQSRTPVVSVMGRLAAPTAPVFPMVMQLRMFVVSVVASARCDDESLCGFVLIEADIFTIIP